MIEGLKVFPLKKIESPKGAVLHILKESDPHFMKISEVYISVTNPGEIKGWKLHTLMSQNFAVPVGTMKFVFYDERKDSPSYGKVQEIEAGYNSYVLIQVPCQIWYSFKNISAGPAHIVNCASMEHDPQESKIQDLHSPLIPYKWS